MPRLRHSWVAAALLLISLGAAAPAVAADVQTLQLRTAPAAEAIRYLVADTLLALASLVALAALVTRRSWAPAAVVLWVASLLAVVGWVLFFAIGVSGPPHWVRGGIWLLCLGLGSHHRASEVA